jgi:hypothetical protein
MRDRKIRRESSLEYRLYFALIFIISLPHAVVRWIMPRRPRSERGTILEEAWAMADRVTPQIFAA